MNIRAWLAEIGLDQYGDAFEANDIDHDVLPDLGDADLREIGVASLGHRKKLLRAIGQMADGVRRADRPRTDSGRTADSGRTDG